MNFIGLIAAKVEKKLSLTSDVLSFLLETLKRAETIDDYKKDSAKNPKIDDKISPTKSFRPPTSPNIIRTS